MAKARESKRAALLALVEARRPAVVSEAQWEEMLRELAPVSPQYLRRLLRSTGLPLAPLVEGVRQDNFRELERTLVNLAREYQAATGAGDRRRARECRQLVITAKDHARLSLARRSTDEAKRTQKKEMVLWMLTWLENPGLFEEWVRLRKRQAGPPPISCQ